MFKVLDEVCQPKKATKYSACIDLFAREDVTIGAGETKIVPLGVKIDLDELYRSLNVNRYFYSDKKTSHIMYLFMRSHKLDLHIRSSLSAKKGLIIANGTGQIDLDYPDEIGIILHNPIKENNFNISNLQKNKIYSSDDDEYLFVESYHTEHLFIRLSDNYKRYIGIEEINFHFNNSNAIIKKGDKVAQITLVEHKSYLMGYESEEERIGGYGSTGE